MRVIRMILRKPRRVRYYDMAYTILNHFNERKDLEIINKEIECPVCYEDVNEVLKLECNHLFCKVCVEKLKQNNQIKCPLCRNIQNAFVTYNLSEEDKKIIMNEFIKFQDEYKIGKQHMLPFDLIIQNIAEKKGIKLD